MIRTKTKMLIVSIALLILTMCMSIPVMAADSSLAVPSVFASSQYAYLNPEVAKACGGDINKMYQHYMTEGVRNGERISASPSRTTVENLFLFMSYNRSDYLNNGLSGSFPFFDVNGYMANNPGLVAQYGNNPSAYLYHYVNFGVFEGKSSGSVLDPAKVIAWNPYIASMNNGKLSPSKIISNYTSTTGQATTLALTNPAPKPAPVYWYCEPKKHEHEWKYDSIDDEKHYKECKDCDEKYKEDHHYHIYSKDASGHKLECSKCDHTMKEAHYDKKGDGKCDRCGYAMPPAHVHNYVLQPGPTAAGHVLKCSCGAVKNEAHTVTYVDNGDDTHAIKCSVCAFVIDPAVACTTQIKWIDGTETHQTVCTVCGHKGAPENCTKDPVTHECTVCGHQYTASAAPAVNLGAAAAPHVHAYAYTPNGNGTHNAVCNIAGCTVPTIANEPCAYDDNGVCIHCGYTNPELAAAAAAAAAQQPEGQQQPLLNQQQPLMMTQQPAGTPDPANLDPAGTPAGTPDPAGTPAGTPDPAGDPDPAGTPEPEPAIVPDPPAEVPETTEETETAETTETTNNGEEPAQDPENG